MPEAQRVEIMEMLRDKNVIFTYIWNTKAILFTDDVPTAGVYLLNNVPVFIINEQFWEGLDDESKLFVICHEQLHVLLKHFERLFEKTDNPVTHSRKNRAADVAVNHSLLNFGFVRDDIHNQKDLCWTDTVFPGMDLSDNETAIYYYNILKRLEEEQDGDDGESDKGDKGDESGDVGSSSVGGSHTELTDELKEEVEKVLTDGGVDKKDIDEIFKEIEENGLDRLITTPGTESGSEEMLVMVSSKKKKSWNMIYKKIVKSKFKQKEKQSWVAGDRRFNVIGRDFELPGTHEYDVEDISNIRVYLDTSGSCVEDAYYFLEEALTFPTNKFKVELMGFDTKVYPIKRNKNNEYKFKGLCGTGFDCIADDVIDNKHDAVVVFTDGYAHPITTKINHKKWWWFITPGGTTNYLPPNSNTVMLEDHRWRV